MAHLTLRVIDGADRGRVFESLVAPVTIGREEGNSIQLNDDRVSRFHIKVQEDDDKIVLTDLESTNGTLVNGEDTRIRILRHGDLITVGRSVILYGSRDEIAVRLSALRDADSALKDILRRIEQEAESDLRDPLSFELEFGQDQELQSTLHTVAPPELPSRLNAVQVAQLAELIEYVHIRIRQVLATACVRDEEEQVLLDCRRWQNLLDLQALLASYLRRIGEPDSDQ